MLSVCTRQMVGAEEGKGRENQNDEIIQKRGTENKYRAARKKIEV